MKAYRVTINGHVYKVQIGDLYADPVQVMVDGEPFAVKLEGEAAGAAPARLAPRIERLAAPPAAQTMPLAGSAAAGDKVLVAPMPGTIMEIRVQAGQSVRRGQELCVLDAMKMKNSIRSARDGVIAEVAVHDGQAVAYGETLFVYA